MQSSLISQTVPVNEISRNIDLTQSKLVMVAIIQNVHQVGIKRVDILYQFGAIKYTKSC